MKIETGGAGVIAVEHEEPHRASRKEILREHPEVRALFGRNPNTAALVLGLIVFQVGLSALAAVLPWWAGVLLAWGVGAFVAHALFGALHETVHNRVWKSQRANQWLGYAVNLPLIAPTAATYTYFHLLHHNVQGQSGRDPDLPAPWESWFARKGFIGKVLWNMAFPVIQVWRMRRLDAPPRAVQARVWLNAGLQCLWVAGLWAVLGPKAVVFLALSFYFTTSLHPLSGRLIQEHHVVQGHQETYSYYGLGNMLSLNLGYHNEHHDFPGVPWNRLPRLKRIAEGHYDLLRSHTSWTWLWWRFLVDRSIGPMHRVVRPLASSRAS